MSVSSALSSAISLQARCNLIDSAHRRINNALSTGWGVERPLTAPERAFKLLSETPAQERERIIGKMLHLSFFAGMHPDRALYNWDWLLAKLIVSPDALASYDSNQQIASDIDVSAAKSYLAAIRG